MLGLNHSTSGRDVTLATYEAVCYQTRDILESLRKDLSTWPPLEKLIVGGGEFSENSYFLQLLADLCGITIERPQTTSPACLGAMISAGVTMKVLNLDNARAMFAPPSDVFNTTISTNSKAILNYFSIFDKQKNDVFFSERNLKYARWKFAIKKCLCWDNNDGNNNIPSISFQDKGNVNKKNFFVHFVSYFSSFFFFADPELAVRCSIPGGIFVISSFALYLITKFLQKKIS